MVRARARRRMTAGMNFEIWHFRFFEIIGLEFLRNKYRQAGRQATICFRKSSHLSDGV